MNSHIVVLSFSAFFVAGSLFPVPEGCHRLSTTLIPSSLFCSITRRKLCVKGWSLFLQLQLLVLGSVFDINICDIYDISIMRFRVNKTSIFLFQGAGYVGVELAAGLAEACPTPTLSPLTFGWMKYDHCDHHLFWQSQVLPDAAASGQIALLGSRFLPGPMGILNTIPSLAGLWRPFLLMQVARRPIRGDVLNLSTS